MHSEVVLAHEDADDEDDDVLKITYTVLKSDSNIDELVASLSGISGSYSLMSGLEDAGFDGTTIADEISWEDITPAPEAEISTVKVTMVRLNFIFL